MLTPEEETQIRQTVRHSLDQILGTTEAPPTAEPAPDADAEKFAEAERIIADETERYYSARGLVKHTSRNGQILWLTPSEAADRRKRSSGRSQRRRRPMLGALGKIDPKVALVWAATLVLAVLLIAYLLGTETLAGIGTGGEIGG